MNVVSIKQLPLDSFFGDGVIYTASKGIQLPYIKQSFPVVIVLQDLIDAAAFKFNIYYNNFFACKSNDNTICSFYSNGVLKYTITVNQYLGQLMFGNQFYFFYQDGINLKCVVIDLASYTAKTIIVTLNGASVTGLKVRQFTSQLFSIISANPTTIHLLTMLDAASISSASDGSTVNLIPFTYSAIANPTLNIDCIYKDNTVHLFGDDGTVEFKLNIGDFTYLSMLRVLQYRQSPFETMDSISELGQGLQYLYTLNNNFYKFYNKIHQNYVWIDSSSKNIFLGISYHFLSPVCYYDFLNKTVNFLTFDLVDDGKQGSLFYSFGCNVFYPNNLLYNKKPFYLDSVKIDFGEFFDVLSYDFNFDVMYKGVNRVFPFKGDITRVSYPVSIWADRCYFSLVSNYSGFIRDIEFTLG
jgi:hypothetical protein